jgi:2-iminoacetate synthase
VTVDRIVLETRERGIVEGSAAEKVVEFVEHDLVALRHRSATATDADVDGALASSHRSVEDFAVLLSPQASTRLEDMARAAHETTIRRFGRAVRLFAPLYLSNECVSTCTYCGFSSGNDIVRRTLTPTEARAEARALAGRGIRHVLLVAGEHARIISPGYLAECVGAVVQEVPSVSVEVQVWATDTYRSLVASGCEGLVVYQETYNRDVYAATHLKGRKRNYDWRLGACDRGAAAGMRLLGIGALLGLDRDWRSDALVLAAHAQALIKRWWRCGVTVSLPRLRPAAGGYEPERHVTDPELVQLVCALRLVLPDVGISLSTRESPGLRDGLLRLGVTQMSAGSHTEPGGYTEPSDAEPQFEISDSRSPLEVASSLRAAGYDPVWVDTIGARRPAATSL